MSFAEDTAEAAVVATDNCRHQRSWRPLLLRLHFYAGVLVAPFILVAAVTGALYAIAPSVERLVYDDLLSVEPASAPLSLAAQAAATRKASPELQMSGMRPAVG